MVVSLDSRLESNKEEEDDLFVREVGRLVRALAAVHHTPATRDKGIHSHGARPVHLIITMRKWIRTSRLAMKNCLSTTRETTLAVARVRRIRGFSPEVADPQ